MAEAMVTIGLDEDERSHIFSLVFGILHLGNVIFEEEKNDEAVVKMEDCKYSKISILGFSNLKKDSTGCLIVDTIQDFLIA